ncbi:MAG: tail fiber domain-containing protein [Bacteroidota bacterium]
MRTINDQTESGRDHVGTSSYQFNYIYGKYIYQNGSQVTSDLRLKENIRDLPNSLEKLKSIRGVKFDFISPEESETNQARKDEMEYMDKNRYGFIAQEIMEIFPDLVKYDEEIDQYSVDYMGIIPILVESVKEQQGIIESLQNQINTISLKGTLKSTSVSTSDPSNPDISELFQNAPNPFNEVTTIRYTLDEEVTSAFIYLYDMTGKQLKSFELHTGTGEISIFGGELESGMYIYCMIADGIIIAQKQMILTDDI